MAKLKFKKTLKPLRGIELAPMIDVISFIVIYFLMNATLEKGSIIKIQLPKSSSIAKETKTNELIITVDGKGNIFLNKDTEPVAVENLTKEINLFLGNPETRKKNDTHVTIKADASSNYQNVVKVIDQINAAGITRFDLAMTHIKE